MTDPAVAEAAYSHHNGRWLAARMAVTMSGPPNVGKGVLSRIARKNNPAAPRCRRAAVNVRAGRLRWLGTIRCSIFAIYQVRPRRKVCQPSADFLNDPSLEFLAVGPLNEHAVTLQPHRHRSTRVKLAGDRSEER